MDDAQCIPLHSRRTSRLLDKAEMFDYHYSRRYLRMRQREAVAGCSGLMYKMILIERETLRSILVAKGGNQVAINFMRYVQIQGNE